MKNEAKVEQLKSYFSDALGADAVLPSHETGRAYLKVATLQTETEKVTLYANVGIEVFPAKVTLDGKKVAVLAAQAAVRFAQQGGQVTSFAPHIKAREPIPGGFRLSKIAFPITAIPGDVAASWKEQNVTSHLTDWIIGQAQAAGAATVDASLITKVVELALDGLEMPPALKHLFAVQKEQPKPAAPAPEGEVLFDSSKGINTLSVAKAPAGFEVPEIPTEDGEEEPE